MNGCKRRNKTDIPLPKDCSAPSRSPVLVRAVSIELSSRVGSFKAAGIIYILGKVVDYEHIRYEIDSVDEAHRKEEVRGRALKLCFQDQHIFFPFDDYCSIR